MANEENDNYNNDGGDDVPYPTRPRFRIVTRSGFISPGKGGGSSGINDNELTSISASAFAIIKGFRDQADQIAELREEIRCLKRDVYRLLDQQEQGR